MSLVYRVVDLPNSVDMFLYQKLDVVSVRVVVYGVYPKNQGLFCSSPLLMWE